MNLHEAREQESSMCAIGNSSTKNEAKLKLHRALVTTRNGVLQLPLHSSVGARHVGEAMCNRVVQKDKVIKPVSGCHLQAVQSSFFGGTRKLPPAFVSITFLSF